MVKFFIVVINCCINFILQNTAGTSSRIALLSLQADNIGYASLTLTASDENQARRINLIKCKSTPLFVSDVITFSEGTYDVGLSGHDIHVVSFTQATQDTPSPLTLATLSTMTSHQLEKSYWRWYVMRLYHLSFAYVIQACTQQAFSLLALL